MKPNRYLIVNADDLGHSLGVNRGIIQAHEGGIVTSASLMVRWEAAAQAAAWACEHPRLSLGLHLDLGEWEYKEGGWFPSYQVVPSDDVDSVAKEAKRQLDSFRDLTHQDPTHLDSHQHVHRDSPVREIMFGLAAELGVPLRDQSPHIRYEGGFYGQSGRGEPIPEGISEEALCRILRSLPPGITELGCHPGLDKDLASTYRREREEEVRVLCAPRVRDLLSAERIELVSFSSLRSGEHIPVCSCA